MNLGTGSTSTNSIAVDECRGLFAILQPPAAAGSQLDVSGTCSAGMVVVNIAAPATMIMWKPLALVQQGKQIVVMVVSRLHVWVSLSGYTSPGAFL